MRFMRNCVGEEFQYEGKAEILAFLDRLVLVARDTSLNRWDSICGKYLLRLEFVQQVPAILTCRHDRCTHLISCPVVRVARCHRWSFIQSPQVVAESPHIAENFGRSIGIREQRN